MTNILGTNLKNKVVAIDFADNLALLVRAKYSAELIVESNMALKNVNQWLQEYWKLKLAPEKFKAVNIKGHDWGNVRKLEKFEMQGKEITTKKAVKYLGLWIDRINFRRYIEETKKKSKEPDQKI